MFRILGVLFVVFVTSSFAATEGSSEITTTKPSEGPLIKPSALLQAWTLNDVTPTASPSLNYRLRRAELKVSVHEP